MSEKTAISWTDHTFNPWWGCVKVSPACTHCYAETFAKRVGKNVWGVDAERRFFGTKHWAEPLRWNEQALKAGVRRRVFCASMVDVFEDREDLHGERARLFVLIDETPALDWLLLTKRPENIARLMPAYWGGRVWPNVWLGTTVENQQYADERIPYLLSVPAMRRFISAEPLLGPISFRWAKWDDCTPNQRRAKQLPSVLRDGKLTAGCVNHLDGLRMLDWVIAGGESGVGARPSEAAWFASLRDECEAAGVPFHFKQWGGLRPKTNGRLLDGREWLEFPR